MAAAVLLVGISGCSSSGKTTLARALRDVIHSIVLRASDEQPQQVPGPSEPAEAAQPTVILLHEDDFYLDEARLPRTKDGLADWDSPASLDVAALVATLQYVRKHGGSLPPDLRSIEDLNSVDDDHDDAGAKAYRQAVNDILSSVPGQEPEHNDLRRIFEEAGLIASTTTELPSPPPPLSSALSSSPLPPWRGGTSDAAAAAPQHHYRQQRRPRQRVIVILDGFLLYSDAVAAVRDQLDVRLFLHIDYHTAKARREARSGYVTRSENAGDDGTGFWVDPPGYFDAVVWPNYVRQHAFLYEAGDVASGRLNRAALERHAICATTEGDRQESVASVLRWALQGILDADRYK